jgi:DNA uptake protein ComE-like DNA-binding protein
MPRQLTAAQFANRRVAPDEVAQRFRERDERLAADTRSDADVWLGVPPPRQSALAQRTVPDESRKLKKAVTLPTAQIERLSHLVDLGRSKRLEIARELVNGRGMSRRQAAKVLGVGEATVRRNVRNDSANGAEKLRTTRELLAQSD